MIPTRIQQRARTVLRRYINGEIHADKKLVGYGLSLRVNYSYRWYCKNAGESKNPDAWQLVSHSAYDKLVQRRGVR